MSNDLDCLIDDISAKHGVVLGKDDPIAMLHTANANLLQEHRQAQEALIADFKAELKSMHELLDKTSLKQAERTLNAAVAASKATITQATEISIESFAKEIETKTIKLSGELFATLRLLKLITAFNVAAGIIFFTVNAFLFF